VNKSGSPSARDWTINVLDAGVVTAHSVEIDSLTLTQTAGAACTPVVTTPLPLVSSVELSPGASGNLDVVVSFSGCAPAARFTVVANFVVANFSANGGGVTGTMRVQTNFSRQSSANSS